MASLKPWYKVVTPREDLREGRPLDASEFAVHLDKVRDGSAHEDYKEPGRFFERTYLTRNLAGLAAETIRRLSGIQTETSAVFNMATQFGGGKTHALTLLYHLAKNGPKAQDWQGVDGLLKVAGVQRVPKAAVAVFVGTEFDSLTGRGGKDGTPVRKTPWGEIAWQLGGKEALAVVAEHEKSMTAPAGDVIREILPEDKPCLILVDELLNYFSRNRKTGLGTQFYHFIQNLSETVRGQKNAVLAVSVPASELEMTADDQADYTRIKKMLDRLGKAVMISSEGETSEIIRRRLFEWTGLPPEARKVASEYAEWVVEHRQQVPNWFPVDSGREAFEETYPFHPMALSVFERKWQALPRFQRTRGVLRLLALWVSRAYRDGFEGGQRDPLIGLGTAPLQDPMFRTAMFEQLGEQRLEVASTTDICGKKDSHATRLDKEAVDTIKKARLHQKAATVIFFESNGGQAKAEATMPEVRLAVAEPDLEIGHVETALEALTEACYYLTVERNKYRFSMSPNLNKLLSDRQASIQAKRIEERVREEIRSVFNSRKTVDLVFFPEKSNLITDRPVLALVVMAPECSMQNPGTLRLVDSMVRESGSSSRTYKSGLIFVVAEDDAGLRDEARKVLAWEDIQSDEGSHLDERQAHQLKESLGKAKRDLKEAVWRSYKQLVLLGPDNKVRTIDMGLVHSSQAGTLTEVILSRLVQDGEITDGVSARFLVRNWPPAFTEWSTKGVRDAFFASPTFPRLLDANLVREGIAKGIAEKTFAYVGKAPGGRYEPFHFGDDLRADDIEISEDMYLVKAEEAQKHIEPPRLTTIALSPASAYLQPGKKQTFLAKGLDQHGREMPGTKVKWSATGGTIDKDGVFTADQDEGDFTVTAVIGDVQGIATVTISKGKTPPPPPAPDKNARLTWTGEVPSTKWMQFYTKVLARFGQGNAMKLKVSIEVCPPGGVSEQQAEDTKTSLRELGLSDAIERE